jgi:hypothetical protein
MFGAIMVCSHPIMPIRRLVNIDTGEVKIEIAFCRGKVWRTAIFDKQTLSASQKIVALSSFGIGVDSENAKQLVMYLSAMENLNYDDLPEVKSVSRLGWMDGYGFSPYTENLIYDGDEQNRHMFNCVRTEGSYEKWLELAKQVRAGNSIVARVMLAASFASVMVSQMDALPFVVHVWGGAGAGKTLGLFLASSVWGSPNTGEFTKTFNGTKVGNELLAAFCGNLPLCLDELQCVKNQHRNQFDELIYMLCEGAGKTRGSRTGGLQRTTTWRNCTISTGEMPITSPTSGMGAVLRVIELNCESERLFADPRGAASTLTRNYGHAGKMFVEQLSAKDAMDIAHDVNNNYLEQLAGKADPKQILSASLILTADALAELLIFDDGNNLKPDDIIPYLTTTAMADANRRAYGWLMDTISSNPNRFGTNQFEDYQGECWGKIETDGYAYIIKSHFDKLMSDASFSSESFLSWAKRKNLLRCEDNRTTITKWLPSIKIAARCIAIKTPAADGKNPYEEDEQVELPPELISDADESGVPDVPVEFNPQEIEAPTEPSQPSEPAEKTVEDLPFL